MKKRLLLGAMLMGAVAVNAQIADGSNAPQLYEKQVLSVDYPPAPAEPVVNYGEYISLQAYLDAGKTVVIDGSATWCGPCWSFHNSKTLETLYTTYGPDASDELRVIFVEADPGTKISELGGVEATVNPGYTERGAPQGDWLIDVPYPVINSDIMTTSAANGGYGLNAFPSLYVIVPSGVEGQPGKVYNMAWDDLGVMVARINEVRATIDAPAMTGFDHYGKIQSADLRYCEAEGDITGYVTSTFGQAITSAEVQLKKDGEVIATEIFTDLNIGGYATGEVNFTGIELDAAADYQMVLLKVNGEDPLTQETAADFTSAEFQLFPLASVESGKNITATVHTDKYPAEMRWGIYNSAGQFVYISPIYTNTNAYKNKTFTYNVNPDGLLDPIDCYGISLYDQYGDGWTDGTTGVYGLTLKSGSTVLFTTDGDIGGGFNQDATFKTNGLLGNETFEMSSFAVYPNPSNGVFNFNTEETIDVTVVDLTGKIVHTAKGLENGGSINLSGLQKGMYIAKINGVSGERNEKLIIK